MTTDADSIRSRGKSNKGSKVQLTYLSRLMTEPFYRYKLTNNSRQGRRFEDRTFVGNDSTEASIRQIRELLDEE